MPDSPAVEQLKLLVGEERAENYIPVRDLQASGAVVTLSSDFDVSTNNPFAGLANALHREPQSITLKARNAIPPHTNSSQLVTLRKPSR